MLRQQADAGQSEVPSGRLAEALDAPPATLTRYLRKLIADHRIERLGHTSATRYRLVPVRAESPVAGWVPTASAASAGAPFASPPWSAASRALMAELDIPLGAREPVSYRRQFVDDYVPNQTFLLPESLAADLYREGRMQGQQPAGTYARKVIEPLLIDLSFSSSRLEGNRYSRLDTEALFKAGIADPTDRDATMLLNHKRAIEFLIEDVPSYGLKTLVVRNLHTLLMQGLLDDDNALGSIRAMPVYISNTVYVPTQIPSLLGEMLDEIVAKAALIKNPVEAAFFLWINLAYLQPVEDGEQADQPLEFQYPAAPVQLRAAELSGRERR
ncbi:MAG: Fic family protein [Pararobbsia sp.]